MTNVQRINIVRKAKKQSAWYEMNEREQDAIIEKLCIKDGFTLADFYATDGIYLNKILA